MREGASGESVFFPRAMTRPKWLRLKGGIVAMLILCACTFDKPTVLASVDDQAITLTDLAVRLVQIPGFKQAPGPNQQATAQAVLQTLVDDKILVLEAKSEQIHVDDAQVDHAIRQHEALLGNALLQIFTHQRGLSKKALRRFYKEQLLASEYLKRIQVKDRPFCGGFIVQSSENCIKRQDFMKSMRHKHQVLINHSAITPALTEILESSR